MGKQFTQLNQKQQDFIAAQKMFFVGTATDTSRVNISPKGMDSFRVIDNNTVAWLNVTGSGNETAAHIQTHPRMTIMFCAYEGNPMILRLYGKAQIVKPDDTLWSSMVALFNPLPGARQIFLMTINMVQTSCGMAVPIYQYTEDRVLLNDWANNKGDEGIRDYWRQKNSTSIDGIKIK